MDNFLAKFLNYLKGPPHDFFQNSEIEFQQDVKVLAQYNLRGASKLGLGQLLGQLCFTFVILQMKHPVDFDKKIPKVGNTDSKSSN